MVFVPSTQNALHNRLICAPVPHPQHGVAQKHRVPRDTRRIGAGAKDAQIDGMNGFFQPVPPTDHVHADPRDARCTGQQHHGLDGFRPHHSQQPADDRVNRRRPAHPQNGPESVLLRIPIYKGG